MKWIRYAQNSVYYVLPILIVGLLLGSFFEPRILWMQGDFAKVGVWILTVLLAVKPLFSLISYYFGSKEWALFCKKVLALVLQYRKEFGLLSFWVLFFHGMAIVIMRFDFLESLLEFWLLLGLISLFALLIGALTSNVWSMKFLKGYRKPVQSTAYLAFVVGMIHSWLFGMEPALVMLLVYLILKIWELIVLKKYKTLYFAFFILSFLATIISFLSLSPRGESDDDDDDRSLVVGEYEEAE